MSKMAELSMEINDLIEQGMTVKFIAAKLGIPFQMVQDEFDNREDLELQKQYEYLSYADECANDDAQYYGA